MNFLKIAPGIENGPESLMFGTNVSLWPIWELVFTFLYVSLEMVLFGLCDCIISERRVKFTENFLVYLPCYYGLD